MLRCASVAAEGKEEGRPAGGSAIIRDLPASHAGERF